MFHQKCGDHVRLSNRNRTATRTASEFNFGLVFSNEPLIDDQLFQIRIDKKIDSWIGSLEIGITTCDPQTLSFPSSATDLRNGTWVLSGKSILKDGRTLLEAYPLNLDRITEGELIGVLKTRAGELEFFFNGVSQGIAADNIPEKVFAVINVYGKVNQVTVVPHKNAMECIGGDLNDGITQCNSANLVPSLETELTVAPGRRGSANGSGDVPQPQERLRFHERTGSLVKLSCNGRSAERLRPLDEFNNAVVMSKKPLVSDTLFEIRIDRLVEKWSGSIEVGVTTHDPATVDFPATMTNMRSGTIMMSGCGILTNGKGTNREYGEFNLDRLTVGDRIGMMRKSSGDLHYFINGLDQGVAASRVPQVVWAVVDLYGMTVKVTIVDRDEREEQNLITRRNTVLRENIQNSINEISEDEVDDSLVFHPNCGSHAAVINNGRTAHRPNALDDFNNAVVLTNRPLKINEVFEVRIDKMVTKWAGSIEIGVTSHSPTDLEYPSTMTNVRSGTWIMTGNGVMHNGTSVIDDYGQNLDKLQAGDRVGVVIRRGGSLHFLVNGEDQGEAGTGLPPKLHAVIDLYGQATQATIVSHCPSCSPVSPTVPRPLPGMLGSSCSLDGTQALHQQLSSEIHFHSVHGRNARLINGGRTASRPRAMVDFNDAVVITNRPLRRGEMFSVIIEKIVDRWSGSIEAGVTAIKPDDLELPGTMTDLDHDTWMLSGFAVMKDGVMVTHGYPLDLDKTKVGNVIGLRRHDDTSLHFYLDGVDQGEACRGLPPSVYPVIDLYGQCAQVSIVSNAESLAETEDSVISSICAPQVEHAEAESSRILDQSESTVLPTQLYLHKWHEVFGKAIKVDETGRATRSADIPSGGLLFSSMPLVDSELFEICLIGYTRHWAGSLVFGVTSYVPSTAETSLPVSVAAIRDVTRYIQGGDLMQNDEILKSRYCQSLDWLRPGNRLGVKRWHDSSLHFYIDGIDLGSAGYNLPKKLYVVVELFGSTIGIAIVSKGEAGRGDAPLALPDIESAYDRATEEDAEESKRNEDLDKSIEDGELLSEIHDLEMIPQQFHECHGRNVQLSESRLAAKRVASYNQGLVLGTRPLARGAVFQVRIESLNTRWVSSLSIGVTVESVLSSSLPVTAVGLKKNTWIVSGDCVYHNGLKVKSRYNVNLDLLPVGHTVGVTVDEEHNLRILVDGVERGIAATNLPSVVCLPLIDLYGMCDQVCIIPEGVESFPASPSVEEHVWSETREKAELEVCEKVATVSSTTNIGGASSMISSQLSNNALRTKSDKMNENIQCSSLSSSTNACTTPTTVASALVSAQPLQSMSMSATSLSLLHLHRKRSNSLQENVYNNKSPSQIVPRSVGGSLAVTPISPVDVRTPPCEYLMACLRLKSWLGLPNGYFRKENRCTCSCCSINDSRQSSNITSSSCTPALSSQSLMRGQQSDKSIESGVCVSTGSVGSTGSGWAVLPLRKRSQNEGGLQQHQTSGDSWHVAYAKVDLGSVRRILDSGRLLTQGEMNVIASGGRKILDRKLDDTNSSQLIINPSLSAATVSTPYKYQYTDPKTKESYLAYAAFELLIRPGSYKVATQTEWVTKESSATSLVALLLRLETNN